MKPLSFRRPDGTSGVGIVRNKGAIHLEITNIEVVP
jgi:hypothetical protein